MTDISNVAAVNKIDRSDVYSTIYTEYTNP